jgi:hypothetical protein
VQIVLAGQPDLRATLDRPDLEQLRQRITVSYHLGPLDVDDTAAYINHRLRRAAAGPPLTFPREVADLIHRRSRGVPRIINVICDAVLLFGYGAERQDIDLGLAAEAVAELEDTGVLAPEQPSRGTAFAQPARAPQPAPASGQTGPRAAAVPPASSLRNVSAESPAEADVRDRALALRAREEAIARREEALAEQRRVMAEQYRLLGMPEGRTARDADRAAAAWPPVTAYPRPAAPPAPVVEFSPHGSAPRAFWARVRRLLFGAPAPALDERS